MIAVDATLLLLLVEAGVAAALVAGGLLVAATRRRARDRTAVEVLAVQVQATEARRATALEALLGKDAEPAPGVLHDAELRLMARLGDVYLTRRGEDLLAVHRGIVALVDHYRRLVAQQRNTLRESRATVEAATSAAKAKELVIQRLKAERDNLSQELAITLQTLDKMSSEFSRMFATEESPSEQHAEMESSEGSL